MKNNYIPDKENEKNVWLNNMASKLPQYAAKYGITIAEVDDLNASAAAFGYWLNYHSEYDKYCKKLTAYKSELLNGVKVSGSNSLAPAAPVFAAAPLTVAPAILSRARSLVQRIKKHTNYTDADGQDLGIIGATQIIDLNAVKPNVTYKLVQGGKPELKWTKAGFEAVRIYFDTTGTGAWTLLAQASYSSYVDKSPLPASGQSIVRSYRIIYVHKDEEVGNYSNIVQVTVTGTI